MRYQRDNSSFRALNDAFGAGSSKSNHPPDRCLESSANDSSKLVLCLSRPQKTIKDSASSSNQPLRFQSQSRYQRQHEHMHRSISCTMVAHSTLYGCHSSRRSFATRLNEAIFFFFLLLVLISRNRARCGGFRLREKTSWRRGSSAGKQ